MALSNFKATISHILYSTSYSPEDWKIVINMMIEKKGKSNKVGDIRTINLIEADFNYNNKKMAKDLLWYCEKNNFLSKEQYSSRHSHSALT